MWYPLDHAEVIRAEAAANGVTPDLVAGVIYRESRFSESARSDRGAVGLMQVLPETAAWIHDQPGGPAAEPERLAEPRVNIAYGVWYLAYLLREYDDVAYALAAYNGGEANLRDWIADARSRGDSLDVPEIPFPETRGFVTGVLQAREGYRRAWGARLERG
jgi:soluble lytic murein transglycosylase